MDLGQLTDALARVFNEEQARVVFWNDPEQEFADVLLDVLVPDVNVLRLDEAGALEVKIRIEKDDPSGRYLLYSPSEEPEYDNDWLLDMRLYSRSFRADRASIILDELGLTHQHLRQHIAKRRKFFDNKERLRKLKQLVNPDDTELDLDRKMLAVASRADQPELFDVVRTLLHSMTEGGDVDLEAVPPAWEQIEKFELDEPFWEMVKSAFGYSDESPTLRNLLIRLFVSDLAHHLGAASPSALEHLRLPRSGTANAVVCLAQWRDSSSKAGSYNLLSADVGSILRIGDLLHGIDAETLMDVPTFLDVDKEIVRRLLERVDSTADVIDDASIRSLVKRRQAGHWVSSVSVSDVQRMARRAVYEALAVAAEFFSLRNEHRSGFDFTDAASMYRGYEADLYRFDQLYRHFCVHADTATSQGWDVLKPLREDVEACYCNWYLANLGLKWGAFVGSGLLDQWQIEGVKNQFDFFNRHVQPWLAEGENRRAFVIVSDAFRYEIANEVTDRLNGEYRFVAKLSSQLGVVPSYTGLGMASLLPHKKLEYNDKGEVLVDGHPCSSFDQRNTILGGAGGVAVRASDLLAMKKQEGREFIEGSRVVYVYHDEIDARGDKAATEADTFDAARKAVGEVADLVRHIINNLNGYLVLVTADHGFLFTETAPNETDKSKLADKPSGTVKAKKRYLLGRGLPDYEEAWHGHTSATASCEGDMEFWIPKAAQRFHFTGGARFIHGGAMLQEIVVPVVTVKHTRGKKGERTMTKQVTVQVLGTHHKITTAKHRFTLIQMDAVGDRTKAATLKVAVYEGDEPVTSIESLTFDSSSDNIDERQKSVILTLQDRQYDKRTRYRLVLRDAGTGIEELSVDVTIDRAIADDFDF
jgi:uncharacterized protein (TIGR02687 family)